MAYAIYSEGGQELAQSRFGYRESKAMAQDLADELGATVYLDTVPSETDPDDDEDVGEAIAPRSRA
jgi:hypothetical protein